MADVNQKRLPDNLLHQGALFRGTQNLIFAHDPVDVEIRSIDEQNFRLKGLIQISFYTTEPVEMAIAFDGEIISQKFPFRTKKWNVTKDIDRVHWEKLLGSSGLGDIFEANFDYNALMASDYVFMRWKEKKVESGKQVPEITIKGFYYIRLIKSTGIIDGFYYYHDCAMFTPLNLKYTIPDKKVDC